MERTNLRLISERTHTHTHTQFCTGVWWSIGKQNHTYSATKTKVSGKVEIFIMYET